MRDAALHALRRAVRRRRADLERGCSAQEGWLNTALRFLGWSNPPNWLFDTTFIYPGLVLIGIWGVGAGVIVNLAGLRGIPTELYEAARIDGAGWLAQLRNVTIPMMSPILFYTLILGVIEVLQYFLVPLVLKNGTGEPGGTTLFFNLNLYQTFFTFQELSYGATMAWLLFGIALVDHARPVPPLAAVRVLRGRAMTRDATVSAVAAAEAPSGGDAAANPAGGRRPPSDPHRRDERRRHRVPRRRSPTARSCR